MKKTLDEVIEVNRSHYLKSVHSYLHCRDIYDRLQIHLVQSTPCSAKTTENHTFSPSLS